MEGRVPGRAWRAFVARRCIRCARHRLQAVLSDLSAHQRSSRRAGCGFTTTIISILFLGGVQLVSVGILGEYIGRIYEEIKQRPLYVVEEKLGFEQTP